MTVVTPTVGPVAHVYQIHEYKSYVGLTLLIRIAEGAPGKPGMQVLKAATSENMPLPQEFIPHTLNL